MAEPGNINSLYNTFSTKYTHYVPDGNGRDKYIIQNNGGMCIESKRPTFTTSMYSKALPNQMMPAPQKAATSFKYLSDGSGRDFYITFNSGGLENPYIPGQKHPNASFFQSLRNNKRIVNSQFSKVSNFHFLFTNSSFQLLWDSVKCIINDILQISQFNDFSVFNEIT